MQIFNPTRIKGTSRNMTYFAQNNYPTIQEILKLTNLLVKEVEQDGNQLEWAQNCYKESLSLVKGFREELIPIIKKLNTPNYSIDSIAEEHLNAIFPTKEYYYDAPDRLLRLADMSTGHYVNNKMQGICGLTRLIGLKTQNPNVKFISSKISNLCNKIEGEKKELVKNLEFLAKIDPLINTIH